MSIINKINGVLMNSIEAEIRDSEAAIPFKSLKMYEENFNKNYQKLREQITADKMNFDQKQRHREHEETIINKRIKEKNLISEFESFVENETKTLKSFINKIEQKSLNEIPHTTKIYYTNIKKIIEKFIYEINKRPYDHEKNIKDAHSSYDKNQNMNINLQQEISLLKSAIKHNEENLRIIGSKLTTLKNFEKNLVRSMKESKYNGRGVDYTEIGNEILKFIIGQNKKDKGVLTLCKRCHGNGQCLACDSTGWEQK